MKNIILSTAIGLLISFSANSQEQTKIIIKKNIDGKEEVIERSFSVESLEDIEDLLEAEGMDIDIDMNLQDGARIMEIIIDEEELEGIREQSTCHRSNSAFLGVRSDGEQNGMGAVVGSVIEGSSADKMGLQADDVITEVNDQTISSFSDLHRTVRMLEAGEEVTIRIDRKGKKKKLKGEIGKKEEDFHYQYRTDDEGHSFQFDQENGEHFNFEFDHENLEEMLNQLEEQFGNLEGQDIHIELDSKEMEEWTRELADQMKAMNEEMQWNHDQMRTRTVVIVVESISDLDAEKVNEQAEPKLRLENDLALSELRFYPNPGDGNFDLNFVSPAQGDLSLMIFDSQGKKVYFEMLGDFEGRYENSIDISNRPAGNYFLQIEQGGKTYSRKIVKE